MKYVMEVGLVLNVLQSLCQCGQTNKTSNRKSRIQLTVSADSDLDIIVQVRLVAPNF
jgi:predicted component of type VI protein secretion system